MRSQLLHSSAMVFVAALACAGCGHVRYPTNYVLNLSVPTAPVAAARESKATLAVEQFQCPTYLCEGRIVYRGTPEEIAFYEFHRWAMDPRDMITQAVADRIRSGSLFHGVALKGKGSDAAYVLRGNIERLEEVDDGGDVRVVCTISAQLLDTNTKSILWSASESQTVAVQNRNVPGVVSSMSAAAQLTISNLVKSLGQALPSAIAQ